MKRCVTAKGIIVKLTWVVNHVSLDPDVGGPDDDRSRHPGPGIEAQPRLSHQVLLDPVEVNEEALCGEVVVVAQPEAQNVGASVPLKPILEHSQVNMLDLQDEVVVVMDVDGAIGVVQVVVVLDSPRRSDQRR